MKKGFTLIELMIVVAIIAILAMIAVPMYQRYIERARNNAAQSYLRQLATAQIARTTAGEDFIYSTAELGDLLGSGFRPDPTVGVWIGQRGTAAAGTLTFVMAAAHRSLNATVYIYDNGQGSGVIEFKDANSATQTLIGTSLSVYKMNSAGDSIEAVTGAAMQTSNGQVTQL